MAVLLHNPVMSAPADAIPLRRPLTNGTGADHSARHDLTDEQERGRFEARLPGPGRDVGERADNHLLIGPRRVRDDGSRSLAAPSTGDD